MRNGFPIILVRYFTGAGQRFNNKGRKLPGKARTGIF